MKATGVIRRIDDLGRIVIPKEIRRSLKINEGDSVEIFVDDNKIILNKYSIIDSINVLSKRIVDSFYKIFNKDIVITDKENIINSSKNNSLNISNLKDKIESREEICSSNYFLIPIVVDSDAIGSIILIDSNISDYDKDIIRLINTFLVKNIEE